MTPNVPAVVKKADWTKRITISIPYGQMRRLKKNKSAQIVKDYQYYVLKPMDKILRLKLGTKTLLVSPEKESEILKILGKD